MHVYELNPLRDPRWNKFIQWHLHGSVFHSPGWLEALSSTYGYDPVVITTSAPNEPLTNGIVFCRIESWLTGRRFVSLPFSDHCEPLVNNPGELDYLLSGMTRQVDTGNWKYVEVRPVSWRPSSRTGLGVSLTYRFHRLDLGTSTQQLFAGFHKDCVQRKIRRAEREGLRYQVGNSESLLRKFYELVVLTRRRQYLPPQPIAWFRRLASSFGDDLKIRIASKGDLPVAAILTLSHKKCMYYKYGGSNPEFNNLGGMVLLLWKTIQEARDHGLEEFDMGRSDADNPGLIAFKERWGAVGSQLSYWTYPRRAKVSRSEWRQRLTKRAVSVTPDIGLEAVGTLLYRHIG
jgi:CelD/BcsL family acetyltransferase involved in cellulose biosynthesis